MTSWIDSRSRTVRTIEATAQNAPSQKIMIMAILRFLFMLSRDMAGMGRHSTSISSVKLVATCARPKAVSLNRRDTFHKHEKQKAPDRYEPNRAPHNGLEKRRHEDAFVEQQYSYFDRS
ncbi:hypothetical protein BPOR_0236g00210 [Botrytis porri]|uniref:Uncharacterized protein n=1 Tax=Botrytis porri TaxID=87229 RepID=A0A4Z1KPA5_9HELO|nr:hypothetical protein BPOR_0236g00210 [Botrytis porri]